MTLSFSAGLAGWGVMEISVFAFRNVVEDKELEWVG